jgi:hypothetical protein
LSVIPKVQGREIGTSLQPAAIEEMPTPSVNKKPPHFQNVRSGLILELVGFIIDLNEARGCALGLGPIRR